MRGAVRLARDQSGAVEACTSLAEKVALDGGEDRVDVDRHPFARSAVGDGVRWFRPASTRGPQWARRSRPIPHSVPLLTP